MNVRWLTLLPAMMIMSTFSGSMVRGEDALSSGQSTAQHSGSALPPHIAERRASIVRLIEAEAK